MSHACVLVAVDVVNPEDREEIKAAVDFQMAPYNENGEWFRDGTRWDWFQIGGRWTGLLTGYDPWKDPVNQETCSVCGGTGKRPGGLRDFGQAWFDHCNGCNGCSGTGTQTKWNLAPYDGDVVQVKNLSLEKAKAAYAFLRNRHWNEGERLGWFGCSAKTECEIKANDPDVLTRRCKTTTVEGASIVVWNEPSEIWTAEFFKRFVSPLKPETVLVVVDYHV